MAKDAITFKLRIDGARETLKAFHDLPKEASDELRDASEKLARTFTRKIRGAALAEGRQAAILAPTVKAVRDRLPTIQAGGSKRIGRNRQPAYGLLFGSEFGAHRRFGWYAAPQFHGGIGRQYKPHRGAASYWFFRTIERGQPEIAAGWDRAADRIINKFTAGG